MKTKKWLWYILTILLTLVVLTGAVGAGFRIGMTQNPEFIKQWTAMRAEKMKGIENGQMPPNADGKTYNPHAQGFGPQGDFPGGFERGFKSDRGHGHGRDGFGSPLFGLIHLIILGALLWLGYKYAKNSGWKLVREPQAVQPVVSEAANVEEGKKSKTK